MEQCDMCGACVPDVDAAIAAGWLPEYWRGDTACGPACAKCAATLRLAADGEMEPTPLLQAPSL